MARYGGYRLLMLRTPQGHREQVTTDIRMVLERQGRKDVCKPVFISDDARDWHRGEGTVIRSNKRNVGLCGGHLTAAQAHVEANCKGQITIERVDGPAGEAGLLQYNITVFEGSRSAHLKITPKALLRMQIESIVRTALADNFLRPVNALMPMPATCGVHQITHSQCAASEALGIPLDRIHWAPEPLCNAVEFACTWGKNGIRKGIVVLVIDIGALTLDIALVYIALLDGVVELIASGTDYCAGDALTNALVESGAIKRLDARTEQEAQNKVVLRDGNRTEVASLKDIGFFWSGRDPKKEGFEKERSEEKEVILHLEQDVGGGIFFLADLSVVNPLCRTIPAYATARAIERGLVPHKNVAPSPDHIVLAGRGGESRHVRAMFQDQTGQFRERVHQQRGPAMATSLGGARILYNILCTKQEVKLLVRPRVSSDISMMIQLEPEGTALEDVPEDKRYSKKVLIKCMQFVPAGTPTGDPERDWLKVNGDTLHLDFREGNGALAETWTIAWCVFGSRLCTFECRDRWRLMSRDRVCVQGGQDDPAGVHGLPLQDGCVH